MAANLSKSVRLHLPTGVRVSTFEDAATGGSVVLENDSSARSHVHRIVLRVVASLGVATAARDNERLVHLLHPCQSARYATYALKVDCAASKA